MGKIMKKMLLVCLAMLMLAAAAAADTRTVGEIKVTVPSGFSYEGLSDGGSNTWKKGNSEMFMIQATDMVESTGLSRDLLVSLGNDTLLGYIKSSLENVVPFTKGDASGYYYDVTISAGTAGGFAIVRNGYLYIGGYINLNYDDLGVSYMKSTVVPDWMTFTY